MPSKKKGKIIVTNIPGMRVNMPKTIWKKFFEKFEHQYKKSIEKGRIRYDCCRGGESDTMIYDFRFKTRKLFKFVKRFIQKFQQSFGNDLSYVDAMV
jgi:hypothetical protein